MFLLDLFVFVSVDVTVGECIFRTVSFSRDLETEDAGAENVNKTEFISRKTQAFEEGRQRGREIESKSH